MARFNNLKLKFKLMLLVGIFVAGFVAYAGFSHNTLNTVKVNGPLYQRIVLGKDLIADILPPPEYIIETYLVVLQIDGETDRARTTALIERIKTLKKDFDTRHEFWVANLPDGTMKDVMVNKAYQPAAEFFDILEKSYVPAVLSGDRDRAHAASRGPLREKYELHRAAIDEVVRLATESNQANETSTSTFIQSRTVALTLTVTSIILIGCFLAFVIARGILKPLGQTVKALEAVAEGRLDCTIDYTSQDEIGSLAEASRTVTGTLRSLTGETAALICSAQRGELDARGNTEGLRGVFSELIEGVNSIMSAIESLNTQVGKQRDSAICFLADASGVLNRIAQRDLTARLDGDVDADFDGIKQALNTAAENLNETLSQVSVTGVQVAAAARQISAGSQNVAQGASTQASSLEEMAGSIAQVASMTRQNADSAKQARNLTDSALDSARRGMQSMERMSTAISRIKESADATARIVKTIDEIAFQTNLLALNAAVEAARAGDAGRGFAVVADEVRNLAMRSAEAAKNTATLIEESARNAEGGVALNNEVVKNLREINDGIGNVGKVMEEVSASSHQQSQGVEHLNKAMDQINAATQQTAANAEESASAAEELTAQAAEMQTTVSSFQLQHVA